eukprot:CAMPEP_0170075178 /NCGR_PEP_ID=MMETSP0019_2-20121128/12354_1 /TAXON_ID=98059 /ORGANISM="Dinobryon sp., Strain UTEXLB2267" /LENGTH=123 /DNA_ID=CAMNT_0010285965 /DNA_START=281 /DNA_END=652 /DNA_ORIENTATION=-
MTSKPKERINTEEYPNTAKVDVSKKTPVQVNDYVEENSSPTTPTVSTLEWMEENGRYIFAATISLIVLFVVIPSMFMMNSNNTTESDPVVSLAPTLDKAPIVDGSGGSVNAIDELNKAPKKDE